MGMGREGTGGERMGMGREGTGGDGKGVLWSPKKSLKLTLDCAFGTVCSVTQPFCLSFCVWNYCTSNQPT